MRGLVVSAAAVVAGRAEPSSCSHSCVRRNCKVFCFCCCEMQLEPFDSYPKARIGCGMPKSFVVKSHATLASSSYTLGVSTDQTFNGAQEGGLGVGTAHYCAHEHASRQEHVE